MTDPLRAAQGATAVPRVLVAAPPGLPLVVRLSYPSYLFISRMREMIMFLPFGLAMIAIGAGLMLFADDTGQNNVLIGLGGIAVGLFCALATPITAKRQLKDGFSLGADHTGVYLRPMLDKNRVVFVPWDCVEGVWIRRWMGPQLVVKPRDVVVESQFALVGRGTVEARAGTAIAQKRRTARLGSNIHAPIPGVNREELLNNLRYQAAGRAPIQS
jgi:hypothetical protein